ncbi:ribonuclease H-like domain-containing protein [Multifurca ochricompacta]|uniref:RNA exonuclease 4 n=1 Tax=Multifurca ochricompacta TaxID=376703 RepID=A0AAD4MFL3_9AGAM|nr:ribonuclease H-like domain-containing protein [Multifurca ochricompacta]
MAPHYGSPTADQVLALSCTVVGVGPGGNTSMVARVAICSFRGAALLECYVVPTMAVTDYRTSTTGITPAHLSSAAAVKFNDVQRLVADIIKDKVIVGHSLWNDLSVLGIPHPAVNTRDVALYQPFRNALRSPNQLVRLPTLTFHLMGRRCQEGQQNPLENARAALDLYRSHANEWENSIREGQWPTALPPSTFSRCYL